MSEVSKRIQDAYEHIVFWKKNLLLKYISEIAKLKKSLNQ